MLDPPVQEIKMQAYVVRFADGSGERAREIVGIFAAESVAELSEMLFAFTDPAACEFLTMGTGGIYWGGRVSMKLPVELDQDGNPARGSSDDLPGAASFAHEWEDAIFGYGDQEWSPLSRQ